MKTVLFIDGPVLHESYRYSRRMFDEFIARGDIAVFEWRKASRGFSAEEINAFLAETIGEDEEWRAVVVSDLSHENLADYACDLWASPDRGEDPQPIESALIDIAPHLTEAGKDELSRIGLDASSATFLRDGHEPVPQPRYQVNPFDLVQNLGLASYPPEIQHPVVKLTQLLAGLPAHILDEECVGLSLSQIDSLLQVEARRGKLVPQDSDKVDVGDRGRRPSNQTLLEMARISFPETTRDAYPTADLILKCAKPIDVLLVSYRDALDNVSASTVQEPPGNFGAVRSEFCIRNHYPDSTRFIVVDRPRSGNEKRVKGAMAFWSSLLVLALNPDRSFGMQSYSLYRLDVGVDYDAFADELKSKQGYASSARMLLDERLQEAEEALRPDEDANAPLPPYASYVTVDFKIPEETKLELPVNKYGWLKDTFKPRQSEPGNLAYGLKSIGRRMKRMPPIDEELYGQDRARFDREMEETLMEPRYALQAASRDFHEVDPLPDDVLTGYRANIRQKDTLERELKSKETQLASNYSLSLFDSDVYDRLMGMVDRRVKARMQPRAYLREVVFVTVITVVAALVAFSPYILGYMGGVGANAASLGISCASVVIVLIAGALALKVSHWQVKALLRGVNKYMRFLISQLRSKADELSNRISDYATYRRGYSLLERQYDERPPYTEELVDLRRRYADLDQLIEAYERDFEALGIEPDVSPENSFLTWVQAEAAIASPSFFNVEPEAFFPERPLNESKRSGEKVTVPYSFIEWLELQEVRLYEPGYERGTS